MIFFLCFLYKQLGYQNTHFGSCEVSLSQFFNTNTEEKGLHRDIGQPTSLYIGSVSYFFNLRFS